MRLLQVEEPHRHLQGFGLLVEDFDGLARGGVDFDPAVVELGNDLDLEVVRPEAVLAQLCDVVLGASGVGDELGEEARLCVQVVCDEASQLQVVVFLVVERADCSGKSTDSAVEAVAVSLHLNVLEAVRSELLREGGFLFAQSLVVIFREHIIVQRLLQLQRD